MSLGIDNLYSKDKRKPVDRLNRFLGKIFDDKELVESIDKKYNAEEVKKTTISIDEMNNLVKNLTRINSDGKDAERYKRFIYLLNNKGIKYQLIKKGIEDNRYIYIETEMYFITSKVIIDKFELKKLYDRDDLNGEYDGSLVSKIIYDLYNQSMDLRRTL